MAYTHSPQRGDVAALPQRGGGSGCLLAAQKNVHRRTFKAGVRGGAPSREDPRRNKSSMRAEASAGLEKSFTRAARRRTGPVSLRHLLTNSGLGKEKRDGRHQGGHTIE